MRSVLSAALPHLERPHLLLAAKTWKILHLLVETIPVIPAETANSDRNTLSPLLWYNLLEGAIFSSVQSLNCVQLFATPWTAACQASLTITNSRSPPKPMPIELVMPSNHLIFCCPLLLLPSVFLSIKVFSNESALHIRWPKYWSFSFNISPSSEHPGLISFRVDWLNLLAVQGTLESLLQHHSSKAWILWCSAFFMVQLSHPYMITGKTIDLTKQTFVGKVISLFFNKSSRRHDCQVTHKLKPDNRRLPIPSPVLGMCFCLPFWPPLAALTIHPWDRNVVWSPTGLKRWLNPVDVSIWTSKILVVECRNLLYLRALQTKPPKEVSFLIKPVCVHAMLLQSCLTLCNPVDCSLPSSFVYGILEAGILEWDAVSSSRGSSWSKGWTYLGIKPATFLPSLPVLCVWKSVSYYYI